VEKLTGGFWGQSMRPSETEGRGRVTNHNIY